MIALVGSVLGASLLGSPHCAAMCGGFVCFYSGAGPGSRGIAHAAYNFGRLLSYLALGALAGSLGAGIERVGTLAGVSRAAAILAGLLMVVWGGARILETLGFRLGSAPAASPAGRWIASRLRSLRDRPAALRGLAIGLLSTLLPCGWLYAFAATAGGTGSALGGMMVMAVFWIGTLPVMSALGFAAQRGLGPLARRLPALSAALLVVLGVLTVAGKMTVAPPGAPVHCALHAGR